jgi:hypothetical protein
MLPFAQSVVVVLLKLLLATVTGNSLATQPPGPASPTEEKPLQCESEIGGGFIVASRR